MKYALRAAVAVAAIAATGFAGGTASAAGPPLNYDQDILSQFDAANSYEVVRHLAVDIGPRRSGLPEEDEAAEYLAGLLRSYGFETVIHQFPFNGTRPAAKVTSPDTTLYNGPNWQMQVAGNSKMTGPDAPITAQVIWVNGGSAPSDFPAETAGKIALMNAGSNAAARNTQVVNAVAAGAVGVILVGTGQSPLNVGTLATPQPDVPVLGAGDMHGDELKKALCEGIDPDASPAPAACADQRTVTLRIATNAWTNLTRAVVIGTRPAVGEENTPPEERKAPIVMVGAHIDSVLGAPGGHDDATGNGVAMEIARVVSQFPLDKEIRIGGFGGEEDGLQGSRAWVNQYVANSPDRERFIGEWQMDMVGTPYEPARLWALTPNGMSNFVVDEAYKAVERMPADKLEQAAQYGFTGLQNCRLGQSDHQAFYDIGIPSALFIWLDYRKPASGICGPTGGTYVTEPEYHTPRDGMNNVSQPRMQIMLDMIGSSFAHNAMNRVDLTARTSSGPLAGAEVTGDCGDGTREFGTTDENGYLEIRVPHATCDFTVEGASATAVVSDVQVHGDTPLVVAAESTSVSGTVPATLSLSIGAPATFGAFLPGVTQTYEASTSANVISTAGDATLSVADPSPVATGHLVNGEFSLPQPLQARARNAANTGTAYNNVGSAASPLNLLTYDGPISNDQVSLQFSQRIDAGDPLRTGTYSKTLTFTLSTTNP